jgi:hypothetical protein
MTACRAARLAARPAVAVRSRSDRGQRVDLDPERWIHQATDLYQRAGGRIVERYVLVADQSEGAQICKIRKAHRQLDNVLQAASGRGERRREVPEHLPDLSMRFVPASFPCPSSGTWPEIATMRPLNDTAWL